jgi:hypothetical protein
MNMRPPLTATRLKGPLRAVAWEGALGTSEYRLSGNAEVTEYGCHLDYPYDWSEGKTGSRSELDTSTSSAYCYDAEAK